MLKLMLQNSEVIFWASFAKKTIEYFLQPL